MKRLAVAALLILGAAACTPPAPTDLVGVVARKDTTRACAQQCPTHYWLTIRRGHVYDPVEVTRADYTACRIGDTWPNCRP